jgi:trehalose-6-phosphatase
VVLRYAIQYNNKEGQSPDFIMCIGDDASDEYMFTAIYSYISEISKPPSSEEVSLPSLFFHRRAIATDLDARHVASRRVRARVVWGRVVMQP